MLSWEKSRLESHARNREEGLSRREAARRFGIDPPPRTVAKMLAFSVPPGYRRSRPPPRPKLDAFTGIIDAILTADEARPKGMSVVDASPNNDWTVVKFMELHSGAHGRLNQTYGFVYPRPSGSDTLIAAGDEEKSRAK